MFWDMHIFQCCHSIQQTLSSFPQHIFKQVHLCQKGSRSQHAQAWQSRMERISNNNLGIVLQQDLGAQLHWSDLISLLPRASKHGARNASMPCESGSSLEDSGLEDLGSHRNSPPVHRRAFQSQCRAEYFRRDDRRGPPNNQAWTRVPDKCVKQICYAAIKVDLKAYRHHMKEKDGRNLLSTYCRWFPPFKARCALKHSSKEGGVHSGKGKMKWNGKAEKHRLDPIRVGGLISHWRLWLYLVLPTFSFESLEWLECFDQFQPLTVHFVRCQWPRGLCFSPELTSS